MRAYELPTSLNINGVAYTIRTDFRAIIDILIAMNDPDLDQQAKTFIMLQILYEEWQNIPFEDLTEACQKACDFIDCGQVDDPNKPKPRLKSKLEELSKVRIETEEYKKLKDDMKALENEFEKVETKQREWLEMGFSIDSAPLKELDKQMDGICSSYRRSCIGRTGQL